MEHYKWYYVNDFFDMYLTSIQTHDSEYPLYGWQWNKKIKKLDFTKFTEQVWFKDSPEFVETKWPLFSRIQKRKMLRDLFKIKE